MGRREVLFVVMREQVWADHQLGLGFVKFEMLVIHSSGCVKKVTELRGLLWGWVRPGDRLLGIYIRV